MVGGNAFGNLIFVARAAFEQTHRRYRAEQPRQFGHFRHIGLFEKHRFLRVEAAGEEIERDLEAVPAPLSGVEQRSHRVIVGDEIKRLASFLKLDGRLHHPEIISQMQRAGGLDARQNSHEQRLVGNLPVASCGMQVVER